FRVRRRFHSSGQHEHQFSDLQIPRESSRRRDDYGELRMSPCKRTARGGFTMIETLCVVATIMILVALMLPAVQQVREQARRLQCRRNLMKIGLALRNYESVHGSLPPGVVDPNPPIASASKGYHFGWMVQILPHLEQSNAYANFD